MFICLDHVTAGTADQCPRCVTGLVTGICSHSGPGVIRDQYGNAQCLYCEAELETMQGPARDIEETTGRLFVNGEPCHCGPAQQTLGEQVHGVPSIN